MTLRLDVLEHGHRGRQRAALRVAGLVPGLPMDDVVKASLYRPAFFGRPWLRLARSLMRGPSEWTAGEREFFGAFVSRLNACRYCAGIHTRVAELTNHPATSLDPIERWREGSFTPRVRATLELLEKMTERPDDLGRADIDALRAADVSDNAIADVLYVGFLFNLINRLANAFGFDWGDEATARKIAVVLNRVSYRVPEFLLR